MENLRQDIKLSLTTNSLVSPADLDELVSDNEEIDMNQQEIENVDDGVLIQTETVELNQIKLNLDNQLNRQ